MMFFNPFESGLTPGGGLVFSAAAGDTPISSTPVPTGGGNAVIPSGAEDQQLLSQLAATVVNASASNAAASAAAVAVSGDPMSHAFTGFQNGFIPATPAFSASGGDPNSGASAAAAAYAAASAVNNANSASAFAPCTVNGGVPPAAATIEFLSQFATNCSDSIADYGSTDTLRQFTHLKRAPKTEPNFPPTSEPLAGHAPTCCADMISAACEGCREEVADKRFIQIGDRSWHERCVRCVICAQPLDEMPTCFTRDGLLYCRQDYIRKFPKRCERCDKPITTGELVMHATPTRTFHLTCFTCVLCGWCLGTGEMYFLGENGSLTCQRHYDGILAQDNEKPTILPLDSSSGAMPTKAENGSYEHDCGERSEEIRKPGLADIPRGDSIDYMSLDPANGVAHTPTTSFSTDCPVDDELSSADGSAASGNGGNKAKRMRTSFKHQQLRLMKGYFGYNHNPDAKDLKQLSAKTGLSKRVLQVWFQNARAKHRRTHPNQTSLPTVSGVSRDGSPQYGMLPNSTDMNGYHRYGGSSISGRTSLSPADSTTMYDACSFADDSASSVGGGNNSDNDCTARPLPTIGVAPPTLSTDVNIAIL